MNLQKIFIIEPINQTNENSRNKRPTEERNFNNLIYHNMPWISNSIRQPWKKGWYKCLIEIDGFGRL